MWHKCSLLFQEIYVQIIPITRHKNEWNTRFSHTSSNPSTTTKHSKSKEILDKHHDKWFPYAIHTDTGEYTLHTQTIITHAPSCLKTRKVLDRTSKTTWFPSRGWKTNMVCNSQLNKNKSLARIHGTMSSSMEECLTCSHLRKKGTGMPLPAQICWRVAERLQTRQSWHDNRMHNGQRIPNIMIL